MTERHSPGFVIAASGIPCPLCRKYFTFELKGPMIEDYGEDYGGEQKIEMPCPRCQTSLEVGIQLSVAKKWADPEETDRPRRREGEAVASDVTPTSVPELGDLGKPTQRDLETSD